MDIQIRQIPASCGHCGYLYPSGYYSDPSGTGIRASVATLETAQVTNPCPMCGRYRGRVLAGAHRLIEDATTLVHNSEHPPENLERLAAFLRDTKEHDGDADGIRERAENDAPNLSPILDKLLEEKPERMGWDTWSTLLVPTVEGLAAGEENAGSGKLEPSEIIYGSLSDYNVTTVQAPSRPEQPQQAARKVGRNDPCPCGSGKKYKKCHGSPAGAV